jgi:hypothetical protein
VAGLAFISEVIRVEADLWVFAVVIVKPYLMMDDPPQLLVAYLTDPAVDSLALIYICVSGSSPGGCLVELFLGHVGPPVFCVPPAHLLQLILCRNQAQKKNRAFGSVLHVNIIS